MGSSGNESGGEYESEWGSEKGGASERVMRRAACAELPRPKALPRTFDPPGICPHTTHGTRCALALGHWAESAPAAEGGCANARVKRAACVQLTAMRCAVSVQVWEH